MMCGTRLTDGGHDSEVRSAANDQYATLFGKACDVLDGLLCRLGLFALYESADQNDNRMAASQVQFGDRLRQMFTAIGKHAQRLMIGKLNVDLAHDVNFCLHPE
jgi:hypothetical protein